MSPFKLKSLPPEKDLETKPILKALANTHRYLAELKGIAESIPNQNILINTLSLQEAKDSSAVENIITTHDELYKHSIVTNKSSGAAKEVKYYTKALKKGFELVSEHNILSIRHILQIQSILENNDAGFRKLPGTKLINDKTGKNIYTPPQDPVQIKTYMKNLESYINSSTDDTDPLVKLAVIHYQFESIHPFYDGNGRTGRILNILYLVITDLLNIPILYMSRYIIKNRPAYYEGLQNVRNKDDWESWILYILKGIEETAQDTILIILKIKQLFLETKHEIKNNYKFYSHDLINNLFLHPYTKIDFLIKDLSISRGTATKYLEQLVQGGILHKAKAGRSNFYVNSRLFLILSRIETDKQ
ncbi:Fic family protein [bacterium]|nr:Fic family protein [bacterium]